MPLFGRLIRPNASVRIEAVTYSRDSSGGLVESYGTVLESGVPVLVSGIAGSRDGRFDGRNQPLTGTCSGDSANLARSDVRLYFESPSLSVIHGVYAEVVSSAPHGATDSRLLGFSWYTARWSQLPTGPLPAG